MKRALIALAVLAFISAGSARSKPAKPLYEPPKECVGEVQTVRGPDWSIYGMVSKTDLKSEQGQAIYILEDSQSQRTYFTTIPGKSLEMYVGRIIAVYGPTQYRADVRMQYIVASHVAMP